MGRGFFYGWIIVGVAFLSMAIWQGIRSSFSVFYSYLVDEFLWGRGEAALAQSIGFIMYMVSVPFIGGLIDRFGPRKVVAPGVILGGGGLLLCSTIRDLWTFYLYYGVLVGLGISFFSIVTYSAILVHWFDKKRGLASGIASAGMGAGTFILVALTQWFIADYGWRTAFFILGLITLAVLLPSNGFLLLHKPEELGIGPDGTSLPSAWSTVEQRSSPSFFDTIRNRRFWLFVTFASLALFSIQIILVHNVRFLVDKGIERSLASFAFAWVGIVSVIFRVFWGWLSDRIGRELSYTLGASCIALSALFLLTCDPGKKAFVYFFVLFFGIGWGATAPSFMAVAADLFKGKHFGVIYGSFESAMYVTSVIGVWLAGYISDITGTYDLAFILVITAVIFSVIFLWITAPRKYRV